MKTWASEANKPNPEQVALWRESVKRQPAWELRAMVRALSIHSWLNDANENARLEAARLELHERRKARV